MHSLVATESPPPKLSVSTCRRAETTWLFAILAVGIAIRIGVAGLPGYRVDIDFFTDWANHLRQVPLDEFYGFTSPYCDYLSGYMYILTFTGWLKGMVTGPELFIAQSFEPWIKAGPIVADMVLSLAVYRLCRHLAGSSRGLLAAAFVALNPGIIFVGAVWGQVESIAAAFYMLGLSSLLLGHPLLAAAWVGMGIVTKPHYAAFLIPVAVAFLASTIRRKRADNPAGFSECALWAAKIAGVPLLVLVVTVQVLLLPFSMSLWSQPGTEWLFHETLLAAGIDSFTSSGAFNLWGTQIAGIRKPDEIVAWLSLSYQTWGYLLFGASLVPSLLLAWRRSSSPLAVLVSASFTALAFFEVMTRMHERYFFLVVPLLAVTAALRPWMLPIFLGASGLFALNLWYVWRNYTDVHANQALTFLASDLSVLLFLAAGMALCWVLFRGEGHINSDSVSPELWQPATSKPSLSTGKLLGVLPDLVGQGVVLKGWLLAMLLVCLAVAGFWLGRTSGGIDGNVRTFRTETLAYRSWQDTGVTVAAGQRLNIVATGLWMHRNEGLKHYGPSGEAPADSKYIMPSAPKGTLIGRIGASKPFLVGENLVFTAESSGQLELVMNDWPTGFDNNRGRVYVTIVVSNP